MNKHTITARHVLTPIVQIARKQRVGHEDADAIALNVLIHLDAAKRGQGPNQGQQFLYKHLIIASVIAAKTRSKRFHDAVAVACDALMKASQRPTSMLDLTTGEYQKIRAALSAYLLALPALDVGLLNDACKIAEKFLSGVPVVSH